MVTFLYELISNWVDCRPVSSVELYARLARVMVIEVLVPNDMVYHFSTIKKSLTASLSVSPNAEAY